MFSGPVGTLTCTLHTTHCVEDLSFKGQGNLMGHKKALGLGNIRLVASAQAQQTSQCDMVYCTAVKLNFQSEAAVSP